MSLTDILKNVATFLQKPESIELSFQLIDAMKLALEMQEELSCLKAENEKLKKMRDLYPLIERHKESFITLKDDNLKLRYCAHCWDAEEKLIQLHCNEECGSFFCPHCKVEGVYDRYKNENFYRGFSTGNEVGFIGF